MNKPYLAKVILSDKLEVHALVRTMTPEAADLAIQLRWPSDTVRVLSIEPVTKDTDLGECEEHERALELHCDSCERIYCESCEYGD